ncbi:NADP-dependent oxidoreductase [Psychrobacter pygoscelis]|uniref:NADP-dependent oxidoreductase n=1 Tax=Psychrobacter pygoscelis TaxID=2488563 RepID=UPI00103DFB73|nr:NADP-dependent oxidoreductase [Psychrobacter pygoscelis]
MTLPQSQSAITLTEFGDPDVLTYQQGLPIPQLQDGEVLVNIAYAGINPVDYKTRQGLGWGADNIKKHQFAHGEPAILGFDMAGTVVASHSPQFSAGDKVAALTFAGSCYAQYNVVDAELLTQVPEGVDLKTAGALPCVGTTAKQLLDFAAIKEGEHVVMSAPAGGVGHIALQLLMSRAANNELKLTLICSPEKYHKLSKLIDLEPLAGWIDYTQEQAFPNLQADVLLDLVGGKAGERALAVVKEGGRVVVLPSIWADKLKQAGADKNLGVEGFIAKPNANDLQAILTKVANNELTLSIQSTYPLAQAAKAHRELEQGHAFGKIVLEIPTEG